LRQTIEKLRDLRAADRAQKRTAHDSPAPATRPVVEAPRRGRAKRPGGDVRVGVFLDVANLAGAARRLYGSEIKQTVDYRRLLSTLVAGRRLVEARAYAIDKGSGFGLFARALREAGIREAVCGRALYTGDVKLEEAFQVAAGT